MSTSDVLAVLATIAGLAMAFSPTLQIRRMRRTRSSNDVSLLYLGMLSLGFVVWISYGVSIPNWVVVGTNAASLTIMAVTILVALRYRRGGAKRAAAALVAEADAKTPTAPQATTSAAERSGPDAG